MTETSLSRSAPPKLELKHERKIVLMIAAVQFVNVLDFMMVMPLGPDFARELSIPLSKLGWIGGSYTASAAIAGLLGAIVLDRFDRRKALLFSLFFLGIATLVGGLASHGDALLVTRWIAGAFGGPATSLALSIIADTVPPDRRGRAMGVVMGAFSIASVFGIPAGLELARVGGWRTPFFAVGALILAVTAYAGLILPPMKAHLDLPKQGFLKSVRALLRAEVLFNYMLVGLGMFAAFSVIPNLSAYFQFNLGFPRERLGLLYLIGGTSSFVAMRLAGRYVDDIGPFVVGTASTVIFITILLLGYAQVPPLLPPGLIFVIFMVSMSIRSVAITSLASRVPRPNERARFMSLQSAVQHIASAVGAFYAAKVLHEEPNGSLVGMPYLAVISSVLSAFLPILFWKVERSVEKKEYDASH
ncbi:MAG: MFS transporter [Bdellovibrionota bacterium]